MIQPNQIEIWLNSVSYEHSQSKATETQYKRVWKQYSKSTNMTAEQIIKDYENAETNHISERTIKRKHSQKIQQWIIELTNKGLTTTSIKVMVGAIMSFYKYNDLSLGHIPQAKSGITYHNKDIEKDEINKIMALSNIREKAIFAIMTQAGLRPHTIKQLKIKHVEKILEPNTPTPCKITIPKEIEKGKFGSHPTFIGEEAIKYTKQYLATRTNLRPESLLFTTQNEKPINTKNTSRTFRLSAKKLKETGAINYQINKGKPSELRLYNLRKYFRKYANQMGFEHVNYLMGHTTKGSDSNYTPKDDEFYRELYKQKATPFLRLETATATETEQLRQQHQKEMETVENKYKQENEKLRHTITRMDKQFALSFRMVTTENSEERAKIRNELKELMIKEGVTTEEELNQRAKEIQQKIDKEEAKHRNELKLMTKEGLTIEEILNQRAKEIAKEIQQKIEEAKMRTQTEQS